MNTMIKFGGKSDSGIATPVRVEDNGTVCIKRIWESKEFTVFDEAISDTSAHRETLIADVSEYGIISLRIQNSHDKPFKLKFYNDSTGAYLDDKDASRLTINIPSNGSHVMLITAEDYPFLNYLRRIRFAVQADEQPTSGELIIKVVAKR